MDLDALDLNELKALKKNVEKAIASFEKRHLIKVRAELEEKAKELGVTLDDVLSVAPKAKRAVVAPKYANPADANQTWTGRGRTPLWMRALLEQGRSADEFLI